MTGLQILGGAVMAGSLIGGYQLAKALLRRRAARLDPVAVMAKVIRLERSSTEGDLEDWYHPIVEYRSQDGQVHQTKLSIVKASAAPRVGKTVSVIYERTNPKNCLEPQLASTDSIALYLALGGLIFLFAIGLGLSFKQINFVPANQVERPFDQSSNHAKEDTRK